VSLKELITKLAELEGAGVLNPQGLFGRRTQSEIERALALLETALRYGVPKEVAYSILEELAIQEAPVVESEPVSPVVESEPVSPVVEEESALKSRISIFRDELMEAAVKAVFRGQDEFILTAKDIARLAGVDMTKNISTFITHYFRDTHLISGVSRADATRVARTKTTSFDFYFSKPLDCSGLWGNLVAAETTRLELPILILDYLEGVEDYLRFYRDSDEFFIKVTAKDYNRFLRVFGSYYKSVYGRELKESLVEKTPINRYLLDAALKRSFPVMTMKQFLSREQPKLSEEEIKTEEMTLKKEFQKLFFTQGVLSQGRCHVNTMISGFSYLVLSTLYHYLKED